MNTNYYQLAKIDNETYEDDVENNTQFTDNNDEFIEFKNNVKEWLLLDDDIITLQNAIKDRKVKNDLNTNNGKIKFTKSFQTKPLNKQFLISRLGDFFKDFSKGEKAASFILDNRDKEEKFKLRRVLNKKELNI